MPPRKNLVEHYDDGTLDLSLSGIQDVPVKDIAAIPKATTLDLSCNTIITLPKTFATSLTHLVNLDLSQNQITSLPENFGLLVNLRDLDLDNNKLESLPLSFGNLKSLRWLDLKRNPLMPKLAQIAGLCLDAQQCQAAARNVVAALRATQEQVNAEISRRKEQQMKQIEKNEEIARSQNKENQPPKKKKKKANKNSTQVNGQTHIQSEVKDNVVKDENVGDMPSVPSEKIAQKPGFLRKVGSILKSLVKFMVVTVMLVVLSGYLLSLFDENLYKSLRNRVIEVIESNVPKQYLKHWEQGALLARRMVANWSAQIIAVSVHCFHRAQAQLVALSRDEVVQQYLENIQSGWHILWIWVSEVYTTISNELPNYFTSVQRFFSEWFTNKS